MTPPIRLRRHTDGHVALYAPNAYRFNWFCRNEDTPKCQWLTDDDVVAPGWSELLVAALPEPDDALSAVWDTSTGSIYRDGDELSAFRFEDPLDVETVRSDALKMLAAVAACEQYRAQREATT